MQIETPCYLIIKKITKNLADDLAKLAGNTRVSMLVYRKYINPLLRSMGLALSVLDSSTDLNGEVQND